LVKPNNVSVGISQDCPLRFEVECYDTGAAKWLNPCSFYRVTHDELDVRDEFGFNSLTFDRRYNSKTHSGLAIAQNIAPLYAVLFLAAKINLLPDLCASPQTQAWRTKA
jgi:hypothetical protein